MTRNYRDEARQYKQKDWLEKEYHSEKKTLSEIAKDQGVDTRTIHYWMEKFNLERRSNSMSKHLAERNTVEMNKKLTDLIEGSLLGDGCLQEYYLGTYYSRSDKHKSFIIWLMNTLESLGIESNGPYQKESSSGATVYDLRSNSYYQLNELRNKWYPEGKKRIPEDFKINNTKMFFHYIGDGSHGKFHYKRKNSGRRCRITMYSLKPDKIVQQLRDQGFKANKTQRGISILKESRTEFLDWLKSCPYEIPESYRYKFVS